MQRRTSMLAALFVAFAGVAAGATTPASLYARLGGETGVTAIVSDAVDAANARAELKPQLAASICALSGGGCRPKAGLDLDSREFAVFVGELRVALRAHEVPLAARNELLEILDGMRQGALRR